MRTTQYVRQERQIAAADTNGIRERWLWGLRILRDPEAMAASGLSLRHGVTEELIHAAAKVGLKLNGPEIRRRIQAARTYKTEAEIAQALSNFTSWDRLLNANFPAYEVPTGEPLADHRTEEERAHARRLALLDMVGDQGALFAVDRFDPAQTTLKELVDNCDEGEAMTASFGAHDRKKRSYVNRLVEAAGGDESMIWESAHALLPDDEPEALP